VTDINELRTILKRMAAKIHTNADLEILCQAFQIGQIILATGERAIAVGGDVTDAVFITGDENLVYIFRGTDAKVVRQIVQDTFKSFKPSALLTHTEFSKSAVAAAEKLAGYWEVPVGRDEVLAQIKSFLAEPTDAIVLHGAGGIGKTRLLLELPELIPSGVSLRYVCTRQAESIEYDLASLDRNGRHVIVVDDAHRFIKLYQLGQVLVTELAGKVTLILTTRSVFKDSVTYQLGLPAGYQRQEIEVEALKNLDIDQLLQTPPCEITDEDTRHAIVHLAKGEPLIAGIAARLVQRGEPIIKINRDDVLTRYLTDIIRDLAEFEFSARYISYLEVLAALGTLNLNNQQLREKVQLVVGISQFDEDRIVERLVKAGLVDRYWMTLKITSEVLADHLLIHHFFQTKQADYQKKIIEPFLQLKPKQILTSLAQAEVKGEGQAGLLLGQKLRELHDIVNNGANIARLSVLKWLRGVDYLRSDDVLLIVADIVDGQELPPESYQLPWSNLLEIKHERVLREAVDILRHTYWNSLNDSIDYLHKLAGYRLDIAEYAQVREQASKALVEMGKFKLNKPYAMQLTLLKKLEVWLENDFTNNLELSLSLIQPMLNMEFDGTRLDPTKPRHILIQQFMLTPSEPLRQIREQALEILYQSYNQSDNLSDKLKIIKSLNGSVFLPGSISAEDFLTETLTETLAWLQPDCQKTAKFLLERVIPQAELPVLDAVAEWLWYAPRFSRYQLDEFEQLKQQLKNNKLYQLYLVLVSNRWRGDSEEDNFDWQAIEQRHIEGIDQYLEGLYTATIESAIYELETIVKQCKQAGENSRYLWFDLFFLKFGEKHPNLAHKLVEKAISENLSIKHHFGHVIGGLYQSDLEVAWSYVKSWTDSDDPILWFAVAKSYHFLDWSRFQNREWEVLYDLTTKQSSPVDCQILELISRFALYNPQEAINFIKIFAASSDESVLLRVADVLCSSVESIGDKWGLKFIHNDDFVAIIQNFDSLSRLDYAVEVCLNRLGQIAPIELLNFIEQRVVNKAKNSGVNKYYNAIHFPYSIALKSIRSSPEYPDILRCVRDWMLRDGFWFYETPDVLKEVAGSLEDPLYSVLMEWIESGDIQKVHAVAKILQEFKSGQLFYSLCREIICRTNDKAALDSISCSISSTPGAIFGRFSTFNRRRLEEITPWLQNENIRVRSFAQQMKESLEQNLERELGREEFEERNW
jgi:hypothetical protein